MKTTQRDIEPLGAMCVEFSDGWDNAIIKVLSYLKSLKQ